MKTILITNQPDIARDAQAAGVARIMVDLETIGKKERQASRTTFLSTHRREDIAEVRAVLNRAELIVRINPWHANSKTEIDHAIEHGADIIMLPMITDVGQVQACIDAVGQGAQFLPLIETSYSMDQLHDIAAHPAVRELYIGLNDLHLSLGQDFLFEPLAEGLIDVMAAKILAQGKTFGFGGIAAMGSGELPAQRILGEHERLKSDAVILSSRFCKDVQIENSEGRLERLKAALHALHTEYQKLSQRSAAQREQDRQETADIIRGIAHVLIKKRHSS